MAKRDIDAGAPSGPAMQRSVGHGTISVKARADGTTRLDRLHQKANAKIRIPRQHMPSLEAVLINTAGGLTGGDRLGWQVEAGPNTHAVVATQACERIYRSAGDAARQTTHISVAGGARLDWLPQETIVFDRSALTRRLHVDLATDAVFVGLETIVLGRDAMGETVRHTSLEDRWRIRRDGELVHADDLRLGRSLHAQRRSSALLGGSGALATIVRCAPGDDEQWQTRVRSLHDVLIAPRVQVGVSAFAGKCVIRLMAPDSYLLRPAAAAALDVLRDGLALPAVWRS